MAGPKVSFDWRFHCIHTYIHASEITDTIQGCSQGVFFFTEALAEFQQVSTNLGSHSYPSAIDYNNAC